MKTLKALKLTLDSNILPTKLTFSPSSNLKKNTCLVHLQDRGST